MKGLLAILVLFALSFSKGEARPENEFTRGRLQADIAASSSVPAHSYNVINYNLFMDWYDALLGREYGFTGKMEVTFVVSPGNTLDSVGFDNDTTYLVVDSAFSGQVRLSTSVLPGKVDVILPKQLNAGDSGIIDMYYHVKDRGVAPAQDSLQKGLYLYYKGEQTSTGSTVPETVAYTMSEPSDARYWMPCYDDPSDKALCEITVRVPTGYVVASNGTLESVVNSGDTSTTYFWKEDYPVATYLMCATAAIFAVIKDSVTIGNKSIPVEYYVYPEDSLGALDNQDCNIDSVVSMLRFYSSIYGDYPFDKYGMTGVEPFNYGGMEHQTITTLNRNYEYVRRDVAHELAHQWWGDMVTLGTWKDIWLNESFATYSEAMELQRVSESQFEQEMQYYMQQFFIEDSLQLRYAVYAPPAGYIFGLAEYYKGAWVLNMLRNLVGDSTFFAILHRYRTDYEYGNAITSDFISVSDSVSGTDLGWFFNEWIFDKGYPVYTKSFYQSGDTVILTINQVQSNAPVFKMPVEVGLYSGGVRTTVTVLDSELVQTFRIPYTLSVDSLVLDPFGRLFARFPGQYLTDVGRVEKGPETYSLLQNYPNPFNGMTNLTYNLARPSNITLELFDVLGRKIETLAHGYEGAGQHEIRLNARNLASGVYVCRLSTQDRTLTVKLVLEK